MELGLTNRVVFVAGSSRGIGLAIARTLHAEGARVVLTGRDASQLQAAADAFGDAARVLTIAGDLQERSFVDAAVAQTLAHWGTLDALVANLGTGSGKPGWQQPAEEWQRLFQMNFFASVQLAEAALPHLLASAAKDGEKGAPSLLFINSIVAVEATPAPLPYSAAKAALLNYAKNLARMLGPQGVRVNSIAPGNIFFEGGSWERHLANRGEQVRAMLANDVPLQRFGTPDEIAALAAWLLSSHARFTTGSCFISDGGQTRVL